MALPRALLALAGATCLRPTLMSSAFRSALLGRSALPGRSRLRLVCAFLARLTCFISVIFINVIFIRVVHGFVVLLVLIGH
jgi:hypothetical protein